MATASGQPDLGAILAAVPVGVSVTTADGAVVYANGATVAEPAETLSREADVDGRRYAVTLRLEGSRLRVLEDRLFEATYIDAQTGLPNRTFAATAIADLTRDGAAFAVAVVAIDGLRRLGEYYGREIGDRLVSETGARLAAIGGGGDLVARTGNGTFVLILQPPGTDDALGARLGDVVERLSRPCHADGFEIFVPVSIGVARAPADGGDLDTLIRRGREAIADGAGGGAVRFHTEEARRAGDDRTRMEQRLRLAIRDRRVCCAFQPKVDFRRDRVVGVEVLMRWRDDGGLIHPPGGMAELAGEIGLVDALTERIAEEALAALPLIDSHFGPDASISLNVAARQAGNAVFMRRLIDMLCAPGRPNRFLVEVTEEALLAVGPFQREVLPMLREAGIRISIDDFGVGYSSLATLADIAADEVKIDRSFITAIHTRPRSQLVLKAIDTLGQALGTSLVAEGIETREELAYVQAATRIAIGQGYFFARPLLLEALAAAPVVMIDGRPVAPARPVAGARGTAPART